MNERLQHVRYGLEAGVGFGLPLTFVVCPEMIHLDHDDRDVLALARGAAPLALEKLLEMLLGVETGDGIDGRVANELLLGEVSWSVRSARAVCSSSSRICRRRIPSI